MSTKLRRELRIDILALILFAAIMVVDKTGLLPAVFGRKWISLLVYLVPYFLVGWDVVKSAALGIKNRRPMDESFLMTLATIGAFVTGENSEAVAVMLFYQIGEWFQSYAVGRSRRSITELMDIVPEYANLELEDGSLETIDADEVEPGSILVIRAGERIPVDAEVLSGESLIDTAALTGESVPRSVHAGDEVISGCVNGDGLLRVRALKAFEDSTVSKVLEMVEEASEKKSHTENFITRFARYYTPIVVAAAVILAIVPSLFTGAWSTWIYRACTFLVISCPCALVISVPLAFFGGIGAASSQGVLVKGSNYLELMAHLDTVVSDKTGTLTMGNFSVSEIRPAEGVEERQLLVAAAAVEAMSTHPIAVSIRHRLAEEGISDSDLPVLDNTTNHSGRGLTAEKDGKVLSVGNARMMEELGITAPAGSDAATAVYVAEGSRYLGALYIRDEVKPDAKRALKEMKEEGVRQVIMLTGDRQSVGDAVAQELNVDHVYAELLPQIKVEKVEELLSELPLKAGKNAKLAFVGDGINDAPVLTRADVGIAMGSLGSDAAIEAADVVIMDDNLRKIPVVMRIARKTVGISTGNIIFALAVKLLILLLGALGIANMWAAVFADVGVAVLCILNSMRLLMRKQFQLPE